MVKINKGHDISVLIRTNCCQEYIQHLAGSKLPPKLHQTLPLSYWIVEVRFGKSPTPPAIRKMGSNLSQRFDQNHIMEDDIEHCGMTVFRICAFHRTLKWLPNGPRSCTRRWASRWRTASTTRSASSPVTRTWQPIESVGHAKDPLAFTTRACRRWRGDPIAAPRLGSSQPTRSHCSGGWKTSSESPGKTWARWTGRTFRTSTAWWPASWSGRTLCLWANGPPQRH